MCYAIFVLCDVFLCFFFLMIRRPPRSTLDRSSAASDVYKRQVYHLTPSGEAEFQRLLRENLANFASARSAADIGLAFLGALEASAVSYTHLRAHETVLDLVCRLLLEKKKPYNTQHYVTSQISSIHTTMSPPPSM